MGSGGWIARDMLWHEQLLPRREETVTTILVVDDEANLVELLDGYLSREGFQVLTAADGLTALDLLSAAAHETEQDADQHDAAPSE
jgi:CheY-like chemotaxis protein